MTKKEPQAFQKQNESVTSTVTRAIIVIVALLIISMSPIIAYLCGGIVLALTNAAFLLVAIFMLRRAIIGHEIQKLRVQYSTIIVLASIFTALSTTDFWLIPVINQILARFNFTPLDSFPFWQRILLFTLFGLIVLGHELIFRD